VQIIDKALLDQLSEMARRNPRLRMNHNLHASYDEPCQRLLNAIEPGSYIRPHRHLTPPRPECFLAVRGRMVAFIFADDGSFERVIPFSAGDATLGVDIPAGVWHAVVSLESGSVFFETKPGPYHPLPDKDFAPWAPAEGSDEAPAYLAGLQRAVEFRTCSAD
jgi:cupin fold WbuC family metalloprotein